MTEKFQVQFLEEAARFLDRLEDKTPVADLEKAERLRQFYFEQKSDVL